MKLLYLMTGISIKGGLERIVFDKINYLVETYDIDVIYFGTNDDKPSYKVNPKVRFHAICGINAYSTFSQKTPLFFKTIKKYRTLIRSIKPDIIINANANLLSWITPLFFKHIPKIIELHQSYEGVRIFNNATYGKNSFQSRFLFFLRKTIYPMYDKIVVLTNKDKIQWGFKNIIVIPNFTNIKPRVDLDYSKKNIIWVGRLTHQKGCDILIKIWNKFHSINKDWNLILIGNTPDKQSKIKDLITNFSINENGVIYIPATENIERYYEQASLFISTSRFEGLPLVLVEAATMGFPIIGFDITGNNEIVKNGINGELVAPYNIDDFIQTLNKYCTNIELRKKCGKESLKIAKAFSKIEIMKKWENLFKDIAVQHSI